MLKDWSRHIFIPLPKSTWDSHTDLFFTKVELWASLVDSGKESTYQCWKQVQENTLEKEMATHSSILAWRIPWTKEPGRLQSMGHKESDTTEQLTQQHFIEEEMGF